MIETLALAALGLCLAGIVASLLIARPAFARWRRDRRRARLVRQGWNRKTRAAVQLANSIEVRVHGRRRKTPTDQVLANVDTLLREIDR